MLELLEWDSKFFDCRIARLRLKTLAGANVSEIAGWCRDQKVECLYFLADGQDSATARLASENQFQFVDMRLTFAAATPNLEVSGRTTDVGPFEQSEIEALKNIAQVSHRDSRFYFDGRFPRDLCDTLYRIWIERSCSGWAQAVFVARRAGEAIGYCTCHVAPDGATGSIGLIAVRADQQGGGAGRQLVAAAAGYFDREGVRNIEVVTQARNLAAQRFYQRMGFHLDNVDVWYHRWFHGSGQVVSGASA